MTSFSTIATPVPADELLDVENPDYFIVGMASGRYGKVTYEPATEAADRAEAAATQAALYEGPWLDDMSALLADTALTYTAGQPGSVVAGDYVRTRAEGFVYQVAASGASDHHVTTAGGVKLYVVPGAENELNARAYGAVSGAGDNAAALSKWAAHGRSIATADFPVKMILPPGRYRTSVTIKYGSYSEWTGGGVLVRHSSMNPTHLVFEAFTRSSGLNNYAQQQVYLRNIHFDGDDTPMPEIGTSQNLVRLESTSGFAIENCRFGRQRRGLVVVMGCAGGMVTGCDFNEWGFIVPNVSTGDGGSALFVGKNYADETDSRNITITGNNFRNGRWTAFSGYGTDIAFVANTISDCDECGVFVRSDAGGGSCSRFVVASNTIRNIRKRYIDAAGIVASGIDCIFDGNVIDLCDAMGISIGEGALRISVRRNRVSNCVNPAADALFTSLAQIGLRNIDTPLNPAYVDIDGNTVIDTRTPRLAPFGIRVWQALGTPEALTGIRIRNNTVIGAASVAANNVAFESGLVGNFCEVGSNHGSGLRIGTEALEIIARGVVAMDFPSIAPSSFANIDVTPVLSFGDMVVSSDIVLTALPANGFANGLILKPFILNATTIRFQLINNTSATVDPANATVSYMVVR